MRFIFIIILIFTFGSSLSADIISQEYFFENPTISKHDNWDIISFEDTRNSGEIGNPTFPYKAINVLLPAGHCAQTIEITFLDEKTLEGNFNLYPMQNSRPVSGIGSGEFKQNLALYRQDIDLPKIEKANIQTHFKNGHPIAMSIFTPVIYNPQKQKIKYYQKVIVTLTTASEQKAIKAKSLLRSDAKVNKQLKKLVDNPRMLNSYSALDLRNEIYEVMVITDDAFATNFKLLTDFYLTRGLRSNIFTTQNINDNFAGSDLQEKMRNAIIEQYQENGISFVLLAGDADEVNYRGFYCSVKSGDGYESNNIPADIYYSALDGTWNDDNDENWGEPGEDDLLPEIAVGRIPFSTSEELENIINKIINYQDSPVLGELEDPLLVGEKLWDDPLTWGGDYLDQLIGYNDDNGYETWGIPEDYNFTKIYDRELGAWNSQDLIAEINRGHSFIHHSGHSNTFYNMRLENHDITNENFNLVNGADHNFSLVYTHGCICGAFDEDDCIAERMLNIDNFMVAGIFNSRFGWFNEGQTEGPSQHLHREFLDAIYRDNVLNIGTAHLSSKIDSAPWVTIDNQYEDGAMRWCFYTANVIGDPTLSIWSSEPRAVSMESVQTISFNTTSLELYISQNDNPVPGITATILHNNKFITKTISDANGIAAIVLNSTFDEATTLDLYISGNNIITQHHKVPVEFISSENDIIFSDQLIGNYPNPFNPAVAGAGRSIGTTIKFSIVQKQQNEQTKIEIYNVKGQRIRELKIENAHFEGKRIMDEEIKYYSIIWDGKDRNGEPVASGVYIYQLKIDNKFVGSKKMTVIK
ncbi:MAG: hypothetical protein KAS49_02165 [Candidatus Cloacimonetes bacterium]|nr:hypothetical protein [Candidatus Cloacimonadota bacterium]